MKKVELKFIPVPTCICLSPDGIISELNIYEFYDLRVQVKETKETGWKVKPTLADKEWSEIDIDGRLENWFNGRLFNELSDYLLELI
jgi:hypothetical protein